MFSVPLCCVQLVFYNKEGGTRQGDFELVAQTRAFGNEERLFTVMTDFRKLVFETDGIVSRDTWVAAIRDCVSNIKGGPQDS